jgi:hypothetical protein
MAKMGITCKRYDDYPKFKKGGQAQKSFIVVILLTLLVHHNLEIFY